MTFRVTDLMLEAMAVGKGAKKRATPTKKAPICLVSPCGKCSFCSECSFCSHCSQCTNTGVSTCGTPSEDCGGSQAATVCDPSRDRSRKRKLASLEAQLDTLLAQQFA